MPSFLALLGCTFIWGPLVGTQSAGKPFRLGFKRRDVVHEVLYDLINFFGPFNPLLRLMVRQSTIGVAATNEAARQLHRLGHKRVVLHPSVGLSINELPKVHIQRSDGTVRFLSISRLIHWKGLHLSMRAFSEVQKIIPNSEYYVVGDGPEYNRLNKTASLLGVHEKVFFLGLLERKQVLLKVAECDVLVHPCLHGAIAMACLEAMAAELPVIWLDLGGPALQVTEETGIKVPAYTPEQVVKDLTDAMLLLARDSHLRKHIGEAARRRVVEHFDCDKKGETMLEIYTKGAQ